MEEIYLTPRKIIQKTHSVRYLNAQSRMMTPTNNSCNNSPSIKLKTAVHLLPVINTPPRLNKFPARVKNPFETCLTALHLPVCSPSLFHRQRTPQQNSTAFEWTIDDVSSFGVHSGVEPCETQYSATPDPIFEERAQAALDSYFNEQSVVPSPHDNNQFRNNQIIFQDVQKSDGICQTVLTLPPILPKAIEDMFANYFTYNEDQQQIHKTEECDTTIDHEARDASLRRKLFRTSLNSTSKSSDTESNYEMELGALSPLPQSPAIGGYNRTNYRTFDSPLAMNHVSPSIISISPVKRDQSFGSLSPISKEKTPAQSTKKIKCESGSSIYRSTPEHSRSCSDMEGSFCKGKTGSRILLSNDANSTSIDQNVTTEWPDDESYDDMQMSSSQSSASNQHTTTPIRRRQRSTNRKNLSQSFSFHLDCDDEPTTGSGQIDILQFEQSEAVTSNFTFQRTDSGFNEVSSDEDRRKHHFQIIKNQLSCADVSMRSDEQLMMCSTPSRMQS